MPSQAPRFTVHSAARGREAALDSYASRLCGSDARLAPIVLCAGAWRSKKQSDVPLLASYAGRVAAPCVACLSGECRLSHAPGGHNHAQSKSVAKGPRAFAFACCALRPRTAVACRRPTGAAGGSPTRAGCPEAGLFEPALHFVRAPWARRSARPSSSPRLSPFSMVSHYPSLTCAGRPGVPGKGCAGCRSAAQQCRRQR